MEDTNILKKIQARKFYLKKITADKIEKDPIDKTTKIKQEVKCSILENTKENLSLKVNTKTFVDPEALFSIELEYIMHFKLKEEITDEEVENNINELISFLGQEISYVIASITKKMIGVHVILPPGLEIDELDK
ncbi:MAG: DUF2294 domain-containing protein [Xylanivirga thermophila]|jgi:hypothetical protein|uniref:hypothetical protein n=1 Tax=Xylanivirga thermophila TaxID=2496273 RepID=UPI0039F61442